MIPTDDQIRHDAQWLGFTDRDTERLLTAARRARSGSSSTDGFKRSHGASGNGRASGISDPTGELATEDQVTPEIERQHELLFDLFQQASASKRGVRNTLERIEAEQRWEKPIGQQAPQCRVPSCDGTATVRGLCDTDVRADNRYRAEHDGEPCPMPVLEAHAQERTKRRQKAS